MIETERLILLKPNQNDRDVISEILSCPKQTKYLPNEAPYSQTQQKAYLDKRITHWENNGFGTFIICFKDNPHIKLGFVGAEYAPNPNYVDIRFGITKEFEGKGFVTEAARALAIWFFANTQHEKLYGVSMVDNVASKAVLKKLGMTPEKNVDLYNCEGLDNYSLEAHTA
ncbi:GNAT family N-acetyltransferase [Marinomonas rhizomae]|uniref:GNAT family N-acetyltransferase n=1 Tax=Marinomonas rhizomae TaxID=491948 RepID=UPI002106226E|nr:GNAT family N-acetyltransferase [Marinomonas rhizomae]UTW00786.1 GNAT family N-acetyltransferase [Marinomonas rhizomae]